MKGMIMRKLLLAGTALAVFAGVGNAADMAVKARPYESVPAGFSWTGIYIGAHGGYEFGALDINTATSGNININPNSGVLGTNPSGGFGGGHLGFNYQFAPAWVIGLRGDIDISGLQGTAIDVTGNTSGTHSVPWHGDVVGRLGYLVTPTVMLYGVGGVAFGEIKDSATVFSLGTTLSNSNVHTGYVAGAGFEWFFNPNMSFNVEWNYYNLGTNGLTFVSPAGVGSFNINDKAAWNAVKGGLSIKF